MASNGWANLAGDVLTGGIAGLGEGIYGLFAQNSAEKAQQQAAADAQKQLEQHYQEAKQYETPYMQAGGQAATQLGGMISSGAFNQAPENFQYQYQEDPAYRNQLATGNQQVMANASSMGSLFSGATMKALQKYGVNMANQNYNQNYNRQFGTYNTQYENNAGQKQNEFQRMYQTANMGQRAAGSLTQGAQQLGQATANLTMQRGNAQAAGDVANAETVGSMIGSAGRIIGGMFAPSQNQGVAQNTSSGTIPGQMIPANNRYGLGLTNNSSYNIGGY